MNVVYARPLPEADLQPRVYNFVRSDRPQAHQACVGVFKEVYYL